MYLHAFLRLFLCCFAAPQRWRDVEDSVMTLLSAGSLPASDFMACVMILLPLHFEPASGLKDAEFFSWDVHGAGMFILQFPLFARSRALYA